MPNAQKILHCGDPAGFMELHIGASLRRTSVLPRLDEENNQTSSQPLGTTDATGGEASTRASAERMSSSFRPPAIPGVRSDVTQPLDPEILRSYFEAAQAVPAELDPSSDDIPDATDDAEILALWPEEAQQPPRYDDSDEGAPIIVTDAEPTVFSHAVRDALSESSSAGIESTATTEGFALTEERLGRGEEPPAAGTWLGGEEDVRVWLEQCLGEQDGIVFYRAKLEADDQPYTALWNRVAAPDAPWHRVPDQRIVRPKTQMVFERAGLRVFERPRGNTVLDYLSEASNRQLPAMAALELGIELAEILESIHGAGLRLYELDPSQVIIEQGAKVRFYAVGGLFDDQSLPETHAGAFRAPEVNARNKSRLGLHSDVYAVAYLVYALLARRSAADVASDGMELPSPRLYRPECPLGIWPHLEPCLLPDPAKRIPHARALRQQLQEARARLRRSVQNAATARRLQFDAWAEVHAGLGKARRGAPQQDRALSVTTEDGRAGLFLIADGVSRSRYGDGAFAAAQVEASALSHWDALEKSTSAGQVLNHAQRADVLRQVARAAGRRIAHEVNDRFAPLPNDPNHVMSTTMVAAFVVHNQATVANLGDSRAYLVRDQTIERISIDHDRITDAMRMGLSLGSASEIRMGAALTRVVGRVSIGADGFCRSEPFDPEIFRVDLLPGDRLVLCSDGITDFAAGLGSSQRDAEQKILECVTEYPDPSRAAYEMVVLANRSGGYDNISCVVIAAQDEIQSRP